ncbi:dimethylaniline monooxygenase [Lentinula edodes]|uniref:Dimethylaniline monooxygenase n=1 Tax=Lentinula edodes TaxID=5353 RepID=A0A1Q3EJM4_LENED|nr:dimethylaniline monooxygenase [Lentinula edodes]
MRDINRTGLERYVQSFASPYEALDVGRFAFNSPYGVEGTSIFKIRWWEEDFDAIVIASGRFTAPNTLDILGLSSQWSVLVILANLFPYDSDVYCSLWEMHLSSRETFRLFQNRNHFITLGYRESPLAMLSFSMVRYHTDSTGINYISHLIPQGYRYSFPFLPQCIDTSRCTNGTAPIQGTKVQSTSTSTNILYRRTDDWVH